VMSVPAAPRCCVLNRIAMSTAGRAG
jgi:hypothetical protein